MERRSAIPVVFDTLVKWKTTAMLADEIYAICQRLIRGMPQMAVQVKRQHVENQDGEEIKIIPQNSDCAPVYIRPMADWIYVLLGRNTSEEIFIKWHKEQEALNRLEKIVRAAIEGSFSEDVWTHDGKIVKSLGIIKIDGSMRNIGGFRTFSNPFRRKERRHYDYAPYTKGISHTSCVVQIQ